ncbi:MAG TPA: DUF1549 domain-containing protein [Roseimicrobium sp.]|nr:DUF1549 domain-containing protein [Roseimicrobium sp.]
MKSLIVTVLSAVAALNAHGAAVDFSHQIVPILREHCAECHTGDKKKGGLSMNTRADLISGGENGPVVSPRHSDKSKLIEVLTTKDDDAKMPPKGPRLSAEKIQLLKAWVDGGAQWDDGFAFMKPPYEPALKPRRPILPKVVKGRTNDVDRILDAYLAGNKLRTPEPIGDAEFARRIHLDLVGLLPEAVVLEAFLADKSKDKRQRLVRELLNNDVAYAEHWLTFWNDLLRNDYIGTGFITGGRKQITKWLYTSLAENKPYDQFMRELIAPPTPASAGFSQGIKWRGSVNASQTVEIQFAQSVGQSFLGINLKCASCHDSFIDRWKLDEAYGIAAIIAEQPIEISRCDKPTGRTAKAAWLFPELGQIDPTKPAGERLKQLADLMTHPDNGRVTRTIVNRLWQRLMGRGIVHPVDAMQSEPWNSDLLDHLAVNLSDNKYDLKKTLELICTSQAYQSKAQIVEPSTDDQKYVYAGPRTKRMTAEQFVDAMWQLTGTAPTKFDAQLVRGKADPASASKLAVKGLWVWSTDNAGANLPKPGEAIALRHSFKLKSAPVRAGAAVTADNSYTLFVNGRELSSDDDWTTVEPVSLDGVLKAGANEILIVAKNAGDAPNLAGAFFEARLRFADGSEQIVATDTSWEWTGALPDAKGKFAKPPTTWTAVAAVTGAEVWTQRLNPVIAGTLNQTAYAQMPMVRASLIKSDLLQRTLGRPNRDQIVTSRPNDLSTLEALDLNNGQTLADLLARGAARMLKDAGAGTDAITQRVYVQALSRSPNKNEIAVAREMLGAMPTEQGVQDLLWAVVMMPEFQLIR